jgi:hypothetical protein
MTIQKVVSVNPKYPHKVTVESLKGNKYQATPLSVPGFSDHVRWCYEQKTLEEVEVEWRDGEPVVTKLYNKDSSFHERSLGEEQEEYTELGGDY